MELKFENTNIVKDYVLSSDETHLITFSGISEKEANKENVFIWDLLNDELIRGFTINKDEKFENFKWSPDAKFFGRIKKDVMIVYESPKMQIIPVKIFLLNFSLMSLISLIDFDFLFISRMLEELDNLLKIISRTLNGSRIKMLLLQSLKKEIKKEPLMKVFYLSTR